jgi:hypothetical protein
LPEGTLSDEIHWSGTHRCLGSPRKMSIMMPGERRAPLVQRLQTGAAGGRPRPTCRTPAPPITDRQSRLTPSVQTGPQATSQAPGWRQAALARRPRTGRAGRSGGPGDGHNLPSLARVLAVGCLLPSSSEHSGCPLPSSSFGSVTATRGPDGVRAAVHSGQPIARTRARGVLPSGQLMAKE